MTKWKLIDENTPKDKPILGLCNHAANEYHLGEGKLTAYGAWAEGDGHAPDGPHVVEWGGGFSDEGGYYEPPTLMPDWWFLSSSEFEIVANPTHWALIPIGVEDV